MSAKNYREPFKQKFKRFCINHRGAVFNIACIFYVLLLGNPIKAGVGKVLEKEIDYNYFLGGIVIFITLAEFIGVHLKVHSMMKRIEVQNQDKSIRQKILRILIYVAGGAHIVTNIILTIFCVQTLGLSFTKNPWVWLSFVGITLKETYLFFYFFKKGWCSRKHKQWYGRKDEMREFWGDAFMFLYGTISYNYIWALFQGARFYDFINKLLGSYPILYILIFIIGWALMIAFALPSRIAYLLEELIALRTSKQRAVFGWTFAISVWAFIIFEYLVRAGVGVLVLIYYCIFGY